MDLKATLINKIIALKDSNYNNPTRSRTQVLPEALISIFWEFIPKVRSIKKLYNEVGYSIAKRIE